MLNDEVNYQSITRDYLAMKLMFEGEAERRVGDVAGYVCFTKPSVIGKAFRDTGKGGFLLQSF